MAKLHTMRSLYATGTPALIPEYERIAAGAEPSRLLKFYAPEIVFGIDSMAETAHATVRLREPRPRIQKLAADVGVPRGLADIGVHDEDVPRLASTALQDACMSTNPRPADEAQLRALFRAAM